MKLLTAQNDKDLIARISGDIDHHSAPGIREEIDRLLLELKPERLLLDLSETDFMDSSGLGLILGRQRKSEAVGARLVLVNPTEGCLKILRLAGMENRIETKFLQGEK